MLRISSRNFVPSRMSRKHGVRLESLRVLGIEFLYSLVKIGLMDGAILRITVHYPSDRRTRRGAAATAMSVFACCVSRTINGV